MATAASKRDIKDFVFEWEGKDRNGKIVRGETRAVGENQVQAMLRRQGVFPTKIKKRRMRSGKKIKPKDIALFTRQLATMMKAGWDDRMGVIFAYPNAGDCPQWIYIAI